MTKEKEILFGQYQRLVGLLEEVDPITNPKLYRSLLEGIDRLAWIAAEHNVPVGIVPSDDVPERLSLTPVEEPAEIEPRAEDPAPDEEAKTYAKEDVRAALAKARKNGTNVAELLSELGYDNFSAVPAGKYGEIMARLGAA